VFLDETGIASGLTRRYGRCPRGERLICKVPFGAWKMTTLIAALRHDRLTAPMLLDGAMTGESFEAYIHQVLAPTLRRGDIVIMDNVPVHRMTRVREALAMYGVTVPEFPAYSPDLNPIEPAIGKMKSVLRTWEPRTPRALSAAVRSAINSVPPNECARYLRHAGYGQPKRNRV
jgi:transposase